MDGYIAEIIVFDTALTTADRARVESYLAAKWSISGVHAPATATSDPVGYWRDKSGNNHIASTTDSTKRPVITSINGRNALDFDGSNDNLIIQGYTAENGLTGLTRYAVARLDAAVATIMTTTSDNSISNAGGARFVNSQGTDVQFSAGNSGFNVTSANVANSGYTLLRDSQRLLGVTYDGSKATVAEAILAHYNGATLPPTSTTGSVISPLGSGGTRLHIGSNVNANNWWNGPICEYLVYNRTLSPSERRRVESYLARRWGITLAPQVSNADAQDWVNRVYANGGTVSTSTANAVNTFCNDIDAAGIRDRFARLNLFCGSNLNAALVPLYRSTSFGGSVLGNATDTNNAFVGVGTDYAETGASGGLTGNGSSKYLQTGLATSALPAIATGHLSVYAATYPTSGIRGLLSSWGSGFGDPIYVLEANRNGAGNLMAGWGNNYPAPDFGAAGTGTVMVSRSGSTSLKAYRNGTQIGSTSTASVAPAANTGTGFGVFCNFGTTAANYSDARLCGYSIGTGMDDSEASAYHTAIQAFQTALGRNV
jgi:hypothetical protein